METLYDMLGARPDDDAESLKNAYRKAAKANHPDRHAGDPEAAAVRFRRIARAYDILRDEKRRAAYDLLLEYQREPLHLKARRTTSHPAYQLAFTAIAGVVVGMVLAVGSYILFAHIHWITGNESARMTADQPPRIVAVEPARRADTVKEQAPSRGPARAPQTPVGIPPVTQGAAASSMEGKGASEATQGPSAPDAAGQTIERSAPPIDPAEPMAVADDPGRNHGAEPPEQPQPTESKASAMSQDEICKRDAAQLAHLRITQGRDEVIRFERELGCKKLRPQVIRLRESVDPQ
jgi:hypothetical protein